MADFYFDSSALVKRYISELAPPGSLACLTLP